MLLARSIARPPSDRVHGLHWAEDDIEGPEMLGGPEQRSPVRRGLPIGPLVQALSYVLQGIGSRAASSRQPGARIRRQDAHHMLSHGPCTQASMASSCRRTLFLLCHATSTSVPLGRVWTGGRISTHPVWLRAEFCDVTRICGCAHTRL